MNAASLLELPKDRLLWLRSLYLAGAITEKSLESLPDTGNVLVAADLCEEHGLADVASYLRGKVK